MGLAISLALFAFQARNCFACPGHLWIVPSRRAKMLLTKVFVDATDQIAFEVTNTRYGRRGRVFVFRGFQNSTFCNDAGARIVAIASEICARVFKARLGGNRPAFCAVAVARLVVHLPYSAIRAVV